MKLNQGPSINLTYEQVEALASQLSPEEQLKLSLKLEKSLAREQLKELFKSVRPKRPVREAEILTVSADVRKRVQARFRRANASDRS